MGCARLQFSKDRFAHRAGVFANLVVPKPQFFYAAAREQLATLAIMRLLFGQPVLRAVQLNR
jgi:hypothetical protein